MFTGLVEALGQVVSVRRDGQGMDLTVDLRELDGGVASRRFGQPLWLLHDGDPDLRAARADFHLTKESLERTWFARLGSGSKLNLERALLPTSRLGGHFVQGHVDGVWDDPEDRPPPRRLGSGGGAARGLRALVCREGLDRPRRHQSDDRGTTGSAGLRSL